MKKTYETKEFKDEEVKEVKEVKAKEVKEKIMYAFPKEWVTIYANSIEEAKKILNSNKE